MIGDRTIAHLREVTEAPDFDGTRYRIVSEIGRGGMGVVYEAEDLLLQRRVAIKVLALPLSVDAETARLEQEARTIARLEHPGIIPVHDVGRLADGRVYYSMKLVRGERLDRYAIAEPADALRLFLKICDAVAFAHAQQIVHRDLKAANVIIGAFGEVLVMDWGVATAFGHPEVSAGTPGYMAPEQRGGGSVDARTDVYALGALLSGLAQCVWSKVPKQVAAIVAKATSDAPSERYADVPSMADDVTRFLDQKPVQAYRENALEIAGRWLSKNNVLVTIIVAYLLMRVIVFLLYRR